MKNALHRTLIFVDDQGAEIRVSPEVGSVATILEIAVENSVEIDHSCGGMGTCGTCCSRFTFASGSIPERNEVEREMAIDRGFSNPERLCCQIECPQGSFEWIISVRSTQN